MSTPDTPTAPASSDPAEIEAHIEATRQDLADTIDALGAKLDVKTRARNRWQETVDAATDSSGRPTPAVQAAAAGVVAVLCGVAALVVWRRSR